MKKENYYKHIRKLYQKPEMLMITVDEEEAILVIGSAPDQEEDPGGSDLSKHANPTYFYIDNYDEEEEEDKAYNPYDALTIY